MAVDEPVPQAGILALHRGRICVVTSRSGKRWVVPKGRLEQGKSLDEIALQEAWEEAGLVGYLHHEPVGLYEYRKSGRTYAVTLYLMQVTGVKGKWPEDHRRERRWLRPEKALFRLRHVGLRRLLASVGGRLPAS